MKTEKPDMEDLFEELDLKQIIGLAVRSEMEAQQRYKLLSERVEVEELERILNSLVKEEEGHERQFRQIFSDFFPDRTLQIPGDNVKPSPDFRLEAQMSVPDLLERVLESEKESEEFYTLLAERLEKGESRRMVAYLASIERDHYELIRSEFQDLINGGSEG